MEGGHVRSIGIDYMGGSYGNIESDGSFCVNAKPESENTIKLVSTLGTTVWTSQTTATSGVAGIECSDEACVDIGEMTMEEVASGCIKGQLTGDLSSLDDLDPYYYSYSTFHSFSGTFEIEEDNTFCLTLPSDVTRTYVYISSRGEESSFCSGSSSFMYWGESDTGLLDTGSWEGHMELGERSCEADDCLYMDDVDISCWGTTDGDGGEEVGGIELGGTDSGDILITVP